MTAINFSDIVDQIGTLKADIAPLEQKLKKLQNILKDAGDGRYEGSLFDATVFTSLRTSLDMDAVRAKLSPQFIVAHTRETETVTIKITAKQLALAA